MHHGALDDMKGFSDPEVSRAGQGGAGHGAPWRWRRLGWRPRKQGWLAVRLGGVSGGCGGRRSRSGTACVPFSAPPLRHHSPARVPLRTPPQSAKAFADKVNAAGGDATVFVYEGCNHGFLNVGEEVRGWRGAAL